jgi:hypothetical protein
VSHELLYIDSLRCEQCYLLATLDAARVEHFSLEQLGLRWFVSVEVEPSVSFHCDSILSESRVPVALDGFFHFPKTGSKAAGTAPISLTDCQHWNHPNEHLLRQAVLI